MENYDDIRPYTDSEIPAAMHRIVRNDFFPLLARYVFPHLPTEQVRDMMLSFSTIYDFQYQVMRIANERIIANSIATFTCDGTSHIEPRGSYLFVSNHRDIMLDASLLQNVLLAHGHDTSEITFGANLMQGELMIDLGKSNKMFRVERGGNMKDFYLSSMHLSNYIRNAVTRLHHSVWIAQRNGRTKDGNDTTDQGIIKMFCMSHPQDKIEALEQLHIVPVTVSYEWEPCDVLKAIELYMSRTEKYIKKPGEDLTSIITGIVQPKGQVHFSIGRPLGHDELMQFNDCTSTDYHRQVAKLLDRRIIAAYRLTPNNYIAHDLLYAQSRYKHHYTAQQEADFIAHLQQLHRYDYVDEPEVLRNILLGIYANPVTSHERLAASGK